MLDLHGRWQVELRDPSAELAFRLDRAGKTLFMQPVEKGCGLLRDILLAAHIHLFQKGGGDIFQVPLFPPQEFRTQVYELLLLGAAKLEPGDHRHQCFLVSMGKTEQFPGTRIIEDASVEGKLGGRRQFPKAKQFIQLVPVRPVSEFCQEGQDILDRTIFVKAGEKGALLRKGKGAAHQGLLKQI